MSSTLAINLEAIDNSKPRTFVCIGVPRGGTTMVAGVIKMLGIRIGTDLADNLEDDRFVRKPRPNMIQAIKMENEAGGKWGWKFPNAANYFEDIYEELLNPSLLIVNRDPVANSQGLVRWHGRSPERAINEVILQQMKNATLAFRMRIPTLFISYEKAISSPELFLSEIADFIDEELPKDLSSILSFMKPGSYKSVSEHFSTQ